MKFEIVLIDIRRFPNDVLVGIRTKDLRSPKTYSSINLLTVHVQGVRIWALQSKT